MIFLMRNSSNGLGHDTSQNDVPFQGEKRSYKDCALDENMAASPACRDIRDTYMKCKHEQVKRNVHMQWYYSVECYTLFS